MIELMYVQYTANAFQLTIGSEGHITLIPGFPEGGLLRELYFGSGLKNQSLGVLLHDVQPCIACAFQNRQQQYLNFMSCGECSAVTDIM